MKTVIRPESEMKNSGIEWVGEIPNSWKNIPLKRIIIDRAGGAWGSEPCENNSIICMRIADFDFDRGVFQNKNESELTRRSYEQSQVNKLLLQTNDICIEKSGGGEKTPVGRAVLFDKAYDALFANFMDRIRIDSDLAFPKYVEYYLRAMYFLSVTTLYIKQTTGIQNLNLTSLLQKEVITIPSISEQQAIADYLDETCSKIDKIIAEAKTSIDEYKNLRESVISNATTYGIKKNRCVKFSSAEWVLEIPTDWDMIPAKALFSQSNERKHADDVQLTASQKYGIISQVEYMKRENSRIVIATQGIENWKHVEPNDFIISLRSFQGGLEKSDVSGCITWHYVVLKPNNGVYCDYFKWLFKSDKYINALQGTCNFIRDGQDLRFSNFIQVPLLAVTIEEQKEIAKYLNKEVHKSDSIITEKQSLIADLEAYKKSLIYEVVTGKRKVV